MDTKSKKQKSKGQKGKRQKRVEKILNFLRTYCDTVNSYGGCAKSVDLLCGCDRNLTVDGTVLIQDIIKAYNQYHGGQLDDLYGGVCRNSNKRGVYQKLLLTDWKRAIDIFYSCGLSIPGLTKEEAMDALKCFYMLVK